MTAGIKDTAHAVEAATVMRLLPTRPRLLALGEPTHGEEVLLDCGAPVRVHRHRAAALALLDGRHITEPQRHESARHDGLARVPGDR